MWEKKIRAWCYKHLLPLLVLNSIPLPHVIPHPPHPLWFKIGTIILWVCRTGLADTEAQAQWSSRALEQFFTTSGRFPGGSASKESAWISGDPCSIPGWGSSPGEGNGNPLHYSCLENSRSEEPGGLQSMGLQRVRFFAKSQTERLTLSTLYPGKPGRRRAGENQSCGFE